jgi:glycosyltransferase involved in cell wall biosynthesis
MHKVLLFSHASNLSGAPIVLGQIAGKLPSYGYEPVLVIPAPGPLEELLTGWGIRYRILKRPNSIRDFVRIVREEDPCLVHVNSLVKTWPVLAARSARRPVVWHVHEHIGDKRLYARIIHLLAGRVLLISRKQLELFRGLEGAFHIPNGVDLERFDRVRAAPRRRGETVVTCIGTIEPRKGLDVLARAASLLTDIPGIRFQVVGDEKSETGDYKREVMDYLSGAGLRDNFFFMGARPDIPEILASTDIFCHPARIEEFGMVILEAMAAKTPVVASRVGEIPRIVEHGKQGLLFETGDHRSLASSIRSLAVDSRLRGSMGRAGFDRVRREYSLDVQVRQVSEIYGGMIGPRSVARSRFF